MQRQWLAECSKCLINEVTAELVLAGASYRFPDKSGSPSWPGISETFRGDSTEFLLMVRLPKFDFVAVGIVYPGEAARLVRDSGLTGS